jgi:arylsulfatase A-like enzyme
VPHVDWKLQVNDRPTEGPQQWLYDLAEDPTEQHNLAASRPDIVKQLKDLLAEHQSESNGPLYLSTTQMPVMIDKTLAEDFVEGDEYIYTPN